MACCYQRLHLYEECAEYLESATSSLKERIKILDQQEKTLLMQNNYSNNPSITNYLGSSRNSTRGDIRAITEAGVYLETENKASATMTGNQINTIQNMISNSGLSNLKKRQRGGFSALSGAQMRSQMVNNSKEDPEKVNLEYLSLQMKAEDECSVQQSNESKMQEFNYKYEKILAQKMQSLRYQCKLHLQICAIMSQLNKHRDALIFGQKSSSLCYQLIKDAQLLCKRQMQQISRQGQQVAQKDEIIEEENQYGTVEQPYSKCPEKIREDASQYSVMLNESKKSSKKKKVKKGSSKRPRAVSNHTS